MNRYLYTPIIRKILNHKFINDRNYNEFKTEVIQKPIIYNINASIKIKINPLLSKK